MVSLSQSECSGRKLTEWNVVPPAHRSICRECELSLLLEWKLLLTCSGQRRCGTGEAGVSELPGSRLNLTLYLQIRPRFQ